jgi:two-component system, OmpR family, KDP operon response regulator KdpE
MTRVLVVDDEPEILRALHINLKARGYDVDTAADGRAALAAAGRRPTDLVIPDLGLPDMEGVEVIHGLRGWSQAPIIVLSGRAGSADKIEALDAGADDYVTKPFNIDELAARLRAVARRASDFEDQPQVTIREYVVDLVGHTVTGPQGEVRLTPTEWHLLEILVRNAGRLVTQRQLLTDIWGPSYVGESNYLRVHMTHLRHKLEANPANPRYFITEPGMGYRFNPDGKPP